MRKGKTEEDGTDGEGVQELKSVAAEAQPEEGRHYFPSWEGYRRCFVDLPVRL